MIKFDYQTNKEEKNINDLKHTIIINIYSHLQPLNSYFGNKIGNYSLTGNLKKF